MTRVYGVSPMQQGMLFHHLLEPGSGADLEQMVMRFGEDVDVAALAEAWRLTAKRHEALRTSFSWSDTANPTQRVHDDAPMEVLEIDQAAYNRRQADRRLDDFLAADRTRGFDLASAPLSRVTVFRRRDSTSVVVWTFHHVVLDGRSFPIVLSDVVAAYDALRAGKPVHLEPSIPYRTFIEWLETYDREGAADYWRSAMAGFSAPTPIPIIGLGGAGGSSGFGEVRRRMGGDSTSALERVAGDIDVTVNTMLQGAWARLLSIYSGETDVVFGTTRACRYGTVPGADSIAGLFINTLPMRVRISDSAAVADWLGQIRAQHLAMRPVEHTPLVEVQAHSDVSPGTRLFDSILVYEAYQLDPRMREETGTGDRVEYELLEQTNYPLLLSVYGGEELDLRLEFDRSLIDPAMAERMLSHVVTILEGMIARPRAALHELHCVAPEERSLLLDEWNPTDTDATPGDVLRRWADRVGRTPHEPALIGSERTLSFAELDAESDRLAARVRAAGGGPGEFVGILLERSVDAIVAMLATLKAGAAYLPLDPTYPQDRLRHMVTDSGTRVVISAGVHEALPDITTVRVDAESSHPDPGETGETVAAAEVSASSPAYIIYTSGSTGTPKGVVVSHGSLVNHADGVADAYGLTAADRVMQFAALSFDVAAEEIFPTWFAGGTVVLRSDAVATDLDELHRFVTDHDVTVLNLPAAFWSTWVDHLVSEPDLTLPASLRLVITGSEKVPTRQYERWSTRVGRTPRWLNAYGPTEATITASVHDPVGADAPPGATMPIGRPIQNVRLVILDDEGRPTPLGVPGELHIGGRGVAIGYHDRAELTDERFVSDPFSPAVDARLYRTGDLARWLPDGTVEFLDRIDDQVKVRGFRIELGEIEEALRALDGVADAAVTARPDARGDDQLIAHVVRTGKGGDPTPEALRESLGRRLPSYMVPVGFGFVTDLPLTPSGKLDRKALPNVAIDPRSGVEHVPPRTDIERDLAATWRDILGIDEPGVRDNFFDAGGNSLSAIRLFSAIQKRTGHRMQLADLFEAPTIEKLAERIGGGAAPASEATNDIRPWVFPIKSSGDKAPLFHLGGASVLRNLANHLSGDRPLYALLEQDLEADHFHTSVDDIVPHCIEGLRSVQPRGPYLIAGLCFGGVVALEMARQLRAEGDDVVLTLMIDSFAPGSLTPRDATAPATTGNDVDPAPASSVQGRGRYAPRRVWYKIKARTWRRTWAPLHEAYRRAGRPMPSWLRDVEEANTIASDAYVARPFDGDVTLFIASDKIEQYEIAPLNGWGDLVGGTLDVAEVVGGHLSVYAEPNVIDLARKLNERLDRIPH